MTVPSLKSNEMTIIQAIVENLRMVGINTFVLSPGTRNSPLVEALGNDSGMKCLSVTDERSAAFFALGYAAQSGMAVALVCTSGSAMLNYAPALSEAFYRHVPLVVISADRPHTLIGRDDGQTIFQQGAYGRDCVKASYNIPVEATPYQASRTVAEACSFAQAYPIGPVHVNLELADNLRAYSSPEAPKEAVNFTGTILPELKITTEKARELGRVIASYKKVMIYAGCSEPDRRIFRALGKLASHPNVVILSEPASNTYIKNVSLANVDGLMAAMPPELAPDLLISFGASAVSGRVKAMLRKNTGMHHWHIGATGAVASDRYGCLTLRIEAPVETVLPQLASAMVPLRPESDYAARWRDLSRKVKVRTAEVIAETPWSDLRAFFDISRSGFLTGKICHLGQGMGIRYADIASFAAQAGRIGANRGVNGIEGCTSTAAGAAMATDRPVVLVTGDMGAFYDLNALALPLHDNFTVMILDNCGGDIFRHISSTRSLSSREQFLACGRRHDWMSLGRSFGFDTVEVKDSQSLIAALKARQTSKRMIIIRTDPEQNVVTLRWYFDALK